MWQVLSTRPYQLRSSDELYMADELASPIRPRFDDAVANVLRTSLAIGMARLKTRRAARLVDGHRPAFRVATTDQAQFGPRAILARIAPGLGEGTPGLLVLSAGVPELVPEKPSQSVRIAHVGAGWGHTKRLLPGYLCSAVKWSRQYTGPEREGDGLLVEK